MDWLANVSAAALTLFVVTIAIIDIRERRIPNVLVFPAILMGWTPAFRLASLGGFGIQFEGVGMGFLLLVIPYLVGGMKAGDVKFLMAIGAFTGATDVVRVLLATVLCYPLMAAIAVIREGKIGVTWLRFRRVWWNFLGFFAPSLKLYAMRLDAQDDPSVSSVKTPFGVAIAAGTLVAIYTDFLR